MMKLQHITIAAAVMVLASCQKTTPQETQPAAVSVKTYYPTTTRQGEIFVSGMVSAKQTAMVSTRLMGTIEKIYVRQGDAVRQGQLLMTINSADLRAKEAQAAAMIAEAQAAANDAQKDYQRYATLHSQKSVSDKELENMALRSTSARARLQIARQGLNEVRSMLSYAQVRAPFAGIVSQKMVDEGTIANPGMPLLMVEQAGELNITAAVPERYVSQVKPGDRVTVEAKSIGARLPGVVSELSPSASMTGGQYAMKVAVSGADRARLRAGMYAGIRMAGKAAGTDKPQVWARKSSLVTRDQLTGVYVVGNDNHAVLHWVRRGVEWGDVVAVGSGLKASDRVIANPSARLYNGQKIMINE